MRKRLRSSEISQGASIRDLDIDIPDNHRDGLVEAQRRIKEAGWSFYIRDDNFHGVKYTMTLRRRIALAAGWKGYSTFKKAGILWHELVHVRQRQRMGHSKFLWTYRTPFGRWLIETPAYRQSVIAYETMTKGRFRSTDWIGRQLVSMRKGYWMGRIDERQYTDVTRKIWNSARMKTHG
jgi:hypothetical protein